MPDESPRVDERIIVWPCSHGAFRTPGLRRDGSCSSCGASATTYVPASLVDELRRPTDHEIAAGASRLSLGTWSYEDADGKGHFCTREEIAHAVLSGLFAASPSPDASNPLVEALEWYADDERYRGHDPEVLADVGALARAALAAHRPEREWRLLFGERRETASVLACDSADEAAQWEHFYARRDPGHVVHPFIVRQAREVGPWRDVTDEGGGDV